MFLGIQIKKLFLIPTHEIELITSLSGGKGGQHVNKTNTKVILRWNVHQSKILNEQQRMLLISNMKLTRTGYLVIQSDTSRSQHQNIKASYKKFKEPF